MSEKTLPKPNKLRKYQEREETQVTSISRVSTPLCNMDLKRGVRGKGSLTTDDWLHTHTSKTISSLTDDKALKEEVDPAHNDHLRYHIHHLLL